MDARVRIVRAVPIAMIAVALTACGNDDKEEAGTAQAATVANRAPVISGTPGTVAYEDALYEFMPTASDPDGDPITFDVNAKPGWAEFDTKTGRFYGTPSSSDRGMHRGIVIGVSDGLTETQLPAIDIQVMPAPPNNFAPRISGSPSGTVTAGEFYDFIPTASDDNGDALTFTIANQPGWAAFDPQIGRLSGTPDAAAIGSYGNIVISATDGIAATPLAPFVIVVNPPPSPNTPPTISGTAPASVLVGDTYSFTPAASDVDGDALSFSGINVPAWLQLSSATGALSGVPGQGDVGIFDGISIVVSDGEAQAALPSFSIEVVDPNRAPTIAGSPPASVLVGGAYSFVPTASDPDGDALTFSVAGQPSWAGFDPASGALTGTPDAARVGTYGSITITVSDGAADATLGPFSIEVVPSASGTATLTWTPPTQNIDGSPLTDLAGYIVYWGTSSGSYSNSIRLSNPGLTSYVVDNLLNGTTYYFVTTAYNDVGLESSFSNEASKAIP